MNSIKARTRSTRTYSYADRDDRPIEITVDAVPGTVHRVSGKRRGATIFMTLRMPGFVSDLVLSEVNAGRIRDAFAEALQSVAEAKPCDPDCFACCCLQPTEAPHVP